MTDYWTEIFEAVKAALSQSSAKFDVREFDDDTATEDSVKALAKRVSAVPQLLVLVGDPNVTGRDSTARVTNEVIPVEVIVAVSNRRSRGHQLRDARGLAWEVRRRLQGMQFEGDTMALSVFEFAASEHLGTSPELTLYSVMFTVSTVVSIDAE